MSSRRGRKGQEDRPRNPPAPKVTRPNAGKDYKRSKCLHGRTGELLVNGERCSKNHPPRCHRFCNVGPNNRESCNRGQQCQYWHPRLCRDSVKNQLCVKEDYTFFHMKGTVRDNAPREHRRRDKEEEPAPRIPQRERRSSFRRESVQGNENPDVPRPNLQPRIRFNSLTSNYTPYPPTVDARQPPKNNNAAKDSESFLLRMIENLKDGIFTRMEDQMSELRTSLPHMVRDLVPNNQLPQQPPDPMRPFNTQQLPHHLMSHMMPHQLYQVSSY